MSERASPNAKTEIGIGGYAESVRKLAVIMDAAADIYSKLPNVKKILDAAKTIVDEAEAKKRDDSWWGRFKRFGMFAFGTAAGIVGYCAFVATSYISLPVGLAIGVCFYLFQSTGKSMWQICIETNQKLNDAASREFEAERIYDSAKRMLEESKCPIPLSVATSDDPDVGAGIEDYGCVDPSAKMSEWIAEHGEVFVHISLVMNGAEHSAAMAIAKEKDANP